jgi:hypothetical protein
VVEQRLLDPTTAPDYGGGAMTIARGFLVSVAVLAALVVRADASTMLDYVTFDGIDYIRWPEEPGRALTPGDLGPEFAVVECSFGEDARGCPYGLDAAAAFMPAGTPIYAVRGHATSFRLAAVWNGRIFLYQAWRNARAKVGGNLYDIVGKIRAVDVQRGELTPAVERRPTTITAPRDVETLVDMIVRGTVRRPQPHPVAEPRYWLTLWLTDGTTLGRAYFAETSELMGGLALPPEFRTLLEHHLAR